MSVFERIRREIPIGTPFNTPVYNEPFTIKRYEPNAVVFSVGVNHSLIPMPEAIWNEIPEFLRGKGWVRIGAGHKTAVEGTLQDFIDKHRSRGTQSSSDANYVAVVLERLKIVKIEINKIERIENRKSSKVKLIE